MIPGRHRITRSRARRPEDSPRPPAPPGVHLAFAARDTRQGRTTRSLLSIWLAGRGWTVTAIDISDVAVSRAREAAQLAGAEVDWVCGDALQTPFPARSFDLLSMQYPALPKAAGEAVLRTLLDTVRPGGLLLAVYHDLDDAHREHMESRGVDPADYVSADELGGLLGDEFTVELHAVEPRIDPPPGAPHIADVVLRARRRGPRGRRRP